MSSGRYTDGTFPFSIQEATPPVHSFSIPKRMDIFSILLKIFMPSKQKFILSIDEFTTVPFTTAYALHFTFDRTVLPSTL